MAAATRLSTKRSCETSNRGATLGRLGAARVNDTERPSVVAPSLFRRLLHETDIEVETGPRFRRLRRGARQSTIQAFLSAGVRGFSRPEISASASALAWRTSARGGAKSSCACSPASRFAQLRDSWTKPSIPADEASLCASLLRIARSSALHSSSQNDLRVARRASRESSRP